MFCHNIPTCKLITNLKVEHPEVVVVSVLKLLFKVPTSTKPRLASKDLESHCSKLPFVAHSAYINS